MDKTNFVSIIIPTLNAGQYIGDCLGAITRLDYPKDKLEVIVVDGGSNDRTSYIAKQYGVTWFDKPASTISAQRNLGASRAHGDILAFIDSDCIAPSGWLRNAVKRLYGEDNVGAVGAEYKLPHNPSWVEKIWDLQVETRRKNGEMEWLPSCSIILPKEHFKKVVGFNEDLITSEDVDLCERLRTEGLKVISDNKISVTHLGNPKTARGFFLKEFWRGRGPARRFFQALPKLKLTRATSFALFTAIYLSGLIIGLVIGVINKDWRVFSISLSGGILSAFTLAVKTLSVNRKWRYIFQLSFLYFVYGAARALSLMNWSNLKYIRIKKGLPILLYHDIREDDFNLSLVEAEITPYILRKSAFYGQMKWLYDNGYKVIGARELTDELSAGSIKGKAVCVVFDDGWISNYEIAYPILAGYGFKATFFVTVSNIGRPEMMTWDQIRRLDDKLISIGSHNLTHKTPTELSDHELEYELKESKKILEERLNRKIDLFSSPTGYYDSRIAKIAPMIGYKGLCFSKIGLNCVNSGGRFSLCLKKTGIKRNYDFKTFKNIVAGKFSVLAALRLKQVLRNGVKAVLGPRSYTLAKSSILRRVEAAS